MNNIYINIKQYINAYILIIILVIIYYILFLNKVLYCENEIGNLFKKGFLASSCTDQEMNAVISTLKKIDKKLLVNITFGKKQFWIYNADLFYIDINADILKLVPKTKEIKLLQEILRLKESPFSLMLFADPELHQSFDNINIKDIKLTSEVEKFLFYHEDAVDFAEYGHGEIINEDNKIVQISYLLIKYAGDSEKLYNLLKENTLISFDLFRENIIKIGKSRQLKICVYPDQPYEKARTLFEVLKTPVRENKGVLFCCIDNKIHYLGTLIEAYEITPLINWYLECIDIKYIRSIRFIRQDINNYLKNSLIQKQYNTTLKEFLAMWKNRKISDLKMKNYISKQGKMLADWDKFWWRFLLDFANEGAAEKERQALKESKEFWKNVRKAEARRRFEEEDE